MARDDDDAVSEERISKRRKDRDEEEEDRSRKKRERDEEDDEERPRKKRDDDRDAGADKAPRPMPMRLVGAIVAALAWGILGVYGSCLDTSRLMNTEAFIMKTQREQEEKLRGFGIRFDDRGSGKGFRYTRIGASFFYMLMSAVLLAGAVVLMMRKKFGMYIALGAPVALLLVEFFAFVVCLLITDFTFISIDAYNAQFFVHIFFSLVVGGTIAFLLLNKDVREALT